MSRVNLNENLATENGDQNKAEQIKNQEQSLVESPEVVLKEGAEIVKIEEGHFLEVGKATLERGLREFGEQTPESQREGKVILEKYKDKAHAITQQFMTGLSGLALSLNVSAQELTPSQQENLDALKHPLELTSKDRSIAHEEDSENVENYQRFVRDNLHGYEEDILSEKKIEDLKNDPVTEKYFNSNIAQPGAYEEYFQGLKPRQEQQQAEFLEFRSAYEKGDNSRDYIKNNINSEKYRQRLSFEMTQSGIAGGETFMIEKRKQNLLDDFEVDPGEKTDHGAFGHYDTEEKVSTLASKQSKDMPDVAAHEFQHESTDGEEYMTPYAKNLYKESINPTYYDTLRTNLENSVDFQILSPEGQKERLEELKTYYTSATELDARKRELQVQLEKEGVWQYDKPFTEAELKKVEELDKAGKITGGAKEFLILIKKEKISEIMNTIA